MPNPVVAVVAEVLGEHYFNHDKLDRLFMEAGAPGEPPPGSCVRKCLNWLKHTNDDAAVDPLKVLGGVLREFMDTSGGAAVYRHNRTHKGQDRVRSTLARSGLAYHANGIVLASGAAPQIASLRDVLRSRDLAALELEFRRALETLDADPPAAVTAASSILESLFKVLLEEEKITFPPKETIKRLWTLVQQRLGLSPASVADDDLKRVLSGLTSIVDGVGALRTHAGSAHGHGNRGYILLPRHAKLAVHSAHTLCLFVLETWDSRRKSI